MQKPFTITSRVLAHLGEDLIKDESIALLELVKNSYDAGASCCNVNFDFDIFGALQEISICDDGCGMNINTIETVWLVIGTDNKVNQIQNPINGRVPLGEKGIGRLGVHKLGKEINLYSKTAKDDEVYVNIDWSKLDTDKGVDDFKIDYGTKTTNEFKVGEKGTKIYIRQLKGEWNNRKLRSVFRDLTTLNSPFDNKSDSFNVTVTSNNHVFRGLPDMKAIMDAGLYYGHCTMEGNRITSFDYKFKPWKTLDKISSRHVEKLEPYETLLVHSVDADTIGKTNKKVTGILDLSKYKIGKIEFDIIIYEKDNAVFGLMDIARKSLNDYLKENSGIRVYRDGIRVFDYGDKGNDWLGIDKRRISRLGGSISNNIIIGSISLDRRESSDLREKTNREGFIEDEAYFAFVDAVNYALDLFVVERNKDRANLISIYRQGKNVTEPVVGELSEAVQLIKEKVPNEEDQKDILNILYRMRDQYNDVKDILMHSANIGINLGAAVHEMEKQINALTGLAKVGDVEGVKKVAEILEKIVANYSSLMLKTIPIKTNISKVVSAVIDNNRFRFHDHKIRLFSNYSKVDFNAVLSRTESIAAITNLVDNSIYWVCRAHSEGRMMYIYITDDFLEGYVTVAVCDNGPGFKINPDLAVRPFVTGKPLNAGMGLGLYIAMETMNEMKGKLLIVNANEINLPISAKNNGIDKAIVTLSFPKA